MFGDGLQIDFDILTGTKHRVANDFEQPEIRLQGLRILFFSLSREVFDFLMKSLIEFREKMHWI